MISPFSSSQGSRKNKQISDSLKVLTRNGGFGLSCDSARLDISSLTRFTRTCSIWVPRTAWNCLHRGVSHRHLCHSDFLLPCNDLIAKENQEFQRLEEDANYLLL